MDVNSEQRSTAALGGLGQPRITTGRGDVDTLVCDPNCATGRREHSTP